MKLILGILSAVIFYFAQVESQQLQGKRYIVDWELNFRGVVRITNNGHSSNCIGTLIHSEWVLTSAVCAIKTFREEMRILFGDNCTFNSAAHIKNTYIHPEFFSENRENDIALLELAKPADESIRTFKIPRVHPSLVAKTARVVKWARGDIAPIPPTDNITMPGFIYNYFVVVLNNELCERYPVNVNQNRLCSYESIACEGDEGAPLVTNEENALVGLVSVSEVQAAICNNYNCMIPVTTYTSVVPYKSWIKSVTQIYIL